MTDEPRSLRGQPEELRARFCDLYNREFPTVLRYARIAAGEHVAEDLCADIFCRAWKAWPRFRGEPDIERSWVMRIARNRLTDHYRRRAHLHVLTLVVSTPAPDADLTTRLAIESALTRLRRSDRDVLALRASGLTHEEIAALQRRSTAAVRKANQRALERLRPHLEGVL